MPEHRPTETLSGQPHDQLADEPKSSLAYGCLLPLFLKIMERDHGLRFPELEEYVRKFLNSDIAGEGEVSGPGATSPKTSEAASQEEASFIVFNTPRLTENPPWVYLLNCVIAVVLFIVILGHMVFFG